MSAERWEFVLNVLDALKAGHELKIDDRQIFRLDIGRASNAGALATECAQAAELLRKHRMGVNTSVDAETIARAVRDQTDRLERIGTLLLEETMRPKGRKR